MALVIFRPYGLSCSTAFSFSSSPGPCDPWCTAAFGFGRPNSPRCTAAFNFDRLNGPSDLRRIRPNLYRILQLRLTLQLM